VFCDAASLFPTGLSPLATGDFPQSAGLPPGGEFSALVRGGIDNGVGHTRFWALLVWAAAVLVQWDLRPYPKAAGSGHWSSPDHPPQMWLFIGIRHEKVPGMAEVLFRNRSSVGDFTLDAGSWKYVSK